MKTVKSIAESRADLILEISDLLDIDILIYKKSKLHRSRLLESIMNAINVSEKRGLTSADAVLLVNSYIESSLGVKIADI